MSESVPKPTGVSLTVLVLSLLLAVAATAALMLAVRPGILSTENPTNGRTGGTRQADPLPAEPIAQKDTVTPRDHPTGQVFYPIPYSSKPNLKLTAPNRVYESVTEDEFGFTWTVRMRADDYKPAFLKDLEQQKVMSFLQVTTGTYSSVFAQHLKPGLVFEDFTWEAKGLRGGKLPPTFEQKGKFTALPNTEGEVIFPIPYPQPAHVALHGNSYTTVTECRANGFRWKNTCEKGREFFAHGDIQWTAKGVRPTDGK